jgi:hypothetical protein
LRLDIEVHKPRAFSREFVDPRRGRASEYAASVTANLSVAEIVHQNENNIWLLAIPGRLLRRLCPNRFDRYNGDT